MGIETWEMAMFLNRNPNALMGKKVYPAGSELAPGLYWDVTHSEMVRLASSQQAPGECVKLADQPDATFFEVTRTFALGGGGPSGEPGRFVP